VSCRWSSRGARLPLCIAFSFVNIVFDLNFNRAVLPERVSIDWLGYTCLRCLSSPDHQFFRVFWKVHSIGVNLHLMKENLATWGGLTLITNGEGTENDGRG
jgi:hypothetical protein